MMKRSIATIGYEGATIEDFVAVLRRASIKRVIDVRAIPLSRKKGFSKNQLNDYLQANGIEYVHLKGLGDPKAGREAARAGNYALFEKIFGKHIASDAALEALELAAEYIREQRSCLMCFEAEHEKCHRSIVADHLKEMTGFAIDNLEVRDQVRGRIAA
jgi:uncharacterized protein (DUF488 family)